MGFDAFGSQASDLNRAGYNSNEGLPNTNNFASSGKFEPGEWCEVLAGN
jgi:hypothetical protein